MPVLHPLAYSCGWLEVKVVNQVTCTRNAASGFLLLVSENSRHLPTKLAKGLTFNWLPEGSLTSFEKSGQFWHKTLSLPAKPCAETGILSSRDCSAGKMWSIDLKVGNDNTWPIMGIERGGGEHIGESLTCDQRLLEKLHYLSLSVKPGTVEDLSSF